MSDETLRNALADILDVVDEWTGSMTDATKLETIREIATKAWEKSGE
jgi:hypothetical protein